MFLHLFHTPSTPPPKQISLLMKQIMDGCTAATHVAFALSDVATIYPITPIASMGQIAQKWGLAGRKNYAGVALKVEELESELGAAGATHGALAAGALATTFTNSQGLMLMISNLFKIAGNRLPGVFHIGTRSVANHALSIFGDHSDVMATRTTGFTFLASANVQETMDLGLVAHLAAIAGPMPVVHFFDGWRTSGEMSTIDVIEYKDMYPLLDWEKIHEFRRNALNPEHPHLRGSAQMPDVYFQNAEAANGAYAAFPAVVQAQMDKVARLTGRQYHLFDYHGHPEPEAVVVSIGSSTEVIEETIDYLNKNGYKVGQVKVRLFRPFCSEALLKAIPESARCVAVLDRTKEPGADGEPLFKDVATAMMMGGRFNTRVIGGRYGLSSKDFDPAMVKAVFDNALAEKPRTNFTVGIDDDVTHLSLTVGEPISTTPPGMTQALFYGIGADGMVGATKQAAHIIGSADNLYAQAYFHYSAKKSGGYTVSELRFGHQPIKSEYRIEKADYIACAKANYVTRFRMVRDLREGGVFLLNCPWSDKELETQLPPRMKRQLALKKARFYVVDATGISQQAGLDGVRVNQVMQTCFFKLMPVLPFDEALKLFKEQVREAYMHEGGEVVSRNLQAIDLAIESLREVAVPARWADEPDTNLPTIFRATPKGVTKLTEDFIRRIAQPCYDLNGRLLPVSYFPADGRMPMGTTSWEKRRIAVDVPVWEPAKCVQCTECSFVCPHAAIRPYLLDAAEKAGAPKELLTVDAWAHQAKGMQYRIQVYPEDCTGCGSCALICPGHALTMVPMMPQVEAQVPLLNYCEAHVSIKDKLLPRFTIDGSQMQQPLMEFSGACAGCGETPYVKLVTQLFGERMIVANATGCSSIWGANYPSNAYCQRYDGKGPAWGNSLFEDNAEYGYGMAVTCRQRRDMLQTAMEAAIADDSGKYSDDIKAAMRWWIAVRPEPQKSQQAGEKLVALLEKAFPDVAAKVSDNSMPAAPASGQLSPEEAVLANKDMLGKKSVWSIGGDGWAYDIGFAGLDHVLASGVDINLLVLDTECYSNTGGQTSKATPLGSCAKYSPDGKRTFKKDLGRMMMTYGTVYVASIALGANFQQAVDALREAEAYPGPSIVICYCPCIAHGIRAGLGHSIVEERLAVESGYWPLYRYNPLLALKDIDPFIQDHVAAAARLGGLPAFGSPSPAENADAAAAGEGRWDKVKPEEALLTVDCDTPEPASALMSYLSGEDRYADIFLVDPAAAPRLRQALRTHTLRRYTLLTSDPQTKPLPDPSSEN